MRSDASPHEADARPVALLFLCVQNAGRSQMAAAFARQLGGSRVAVYSGGSSPTERINPVVRQAMLELGIDLTGAAPRQMTDDIVQGADIVITMGCGDTCPVYPGKRYLDWPVDDPAGLPIELVRPIREEILSRVQDLLAQLSITVN